MREWLTLPARVPDGTIGSMEDSLHPWKSETLPSTTLMHKAGAFIALALASAAFVVMVLWPLVAD